MRLSAQDGRMSSLETSLIASAMGWERAVKAYAHGAHTHLNAREGFALEPCERQHHDG